MHVLLVQLIVASIQEDWEENFDENLKPYYKHVKTGESSREDANERCATILCGCASRTMTGALPLRKRHLNLCANWS
jgi:hypothetical protein